MSLYRNILKEAFFSSWKNKYLWFFGLFATLLGGVSEMEIIFRNTNNDYFGGLLSDYSMWANNPIFTRDGWINIVQNISRDSFMAFVMISLLLVVLLLLLFMLWLTIVSQSALVYSAAKIKLEKKHFLKDGLMAGINKFWPALGLNFLLKIILFLLFLLLSLPAVLSASSNGIGRSGLIFVLLFIIFIPLSIIISFIVKYAIAFVVIKNEKIGKALKEGWKLFLANWLISIEMAFLLFFIFFITTLLLIFLLFILAIPILFGVLLLSGLFSTINFSIIIVGAIIFFVIVIVIFGSFITTFQISAWTNLFIELISKGGVSKISRLFNK